MAYMTFVVIQNCYKNDTNSLSKKSFMIARRACAQTDVCKNDLEDAWSESESDHGV